MKNEDIYPDLMVLVTHDQGELLSSPLPAKILRRDASIDHGEAWSLQFHDSKETASYHCEYFRPMTRYDKALMIDASALMNWLNS